MTFGAVLAEYQTLRRRLAIHVGPKTPGDVTVKAPVGDADELSFLRLVFWAYALVQEEAKVALSFLGKLPPPFAGGRVVAEVSTLRTWAAHNLSLANPDHVRTLKQAMVWFRRACGASEPSEPEQWSACFRTLCSELTALLHRSVQACDVLDHETDGPANVAELQRRVDRTWEAYLFDRFVEDAAKHLGYQGLDVVSFRRPNLENWRKVVAAAADGTCDRVLTLRIEADLQTLLGNALPLTATEILSRIALGGTRELAALVLATRSGGNTSAPAFEQLLRALDTALAASTAGA